MESGQLEAYDVICSVALLVARALTLIFSDRKKDIGRGRCPYETSPGTCLIEFSMHEPRQVGNAGWETIHTKG